MDYGKIITRSWQIIWKHKWLWWLGILAAWTEGGTSLSSFSNSGYNWPNSNTPTQPENTINGGISAVKGIPRVLGASTQNQNWDNFVTDAANWIVNYWWILLIILILLLGLLIILQYISYSAKAGIFLSVKSLENSEQSLGFWSAFRAGRKFGWRLFGLNIVISLISLLFLMILLLPVSALWYANKDLHPFPLGVTIVMIAYAFLAVIGMIVIAVYLNIVKRLAERVVVLNKQRIMEAFQYARRIFRRQRGHTLVVWLIEIGLGFAFSLAAVFAFIAVAAVLVALGAVVYLISPGVGLGLYVMMAILIVMAFLFGISGVITAFKVSYWTLAYRALEYLTEHPQHKT